VLIKGRPSFQKGDEATDLKTGDRLWVCRANSEAQTVTLLTEGLYVQYDAEAKGVKGKALDAIKDRYAKQGLIRPFSELTKCRLQFLTTEIPSDIIQEAGQVEGQNLVNIVESNEKNYWPQDGKGIRFPNNNCTFCPMRGICTGNDRLRDELLVKLGAAAPEEKDWLDDLGV
jgi:hypothetical protein